MEAMHAKMKDKAPDTPKISTSQILAVKPASNTMLDGLQIQEDVCTGAYVNPTDFRGCTIFS